ALVSGRLQSDRAVRGRWRCCTCALYGFQPGFVMVAWRRLWTCLAGESNDLLGELRDLVARAVRGFWVLRDVLPSCFARVVPEPLGLGPPEHPPWVGLNEGLRASPTSGHG